MGSTKDKRASVGQPFISARLDAGVDFYFLAFFAFFFFTIVSSFCSDLGKSESCLEPINGPNSFNSKSRDLFHTMVNKVEVMQGALRSRLTRTCCGTPAGSSSPTMASIPERCKPTSATRVSSTLCATPNLRLQGSRGFGETKLDVKRLELLHEFAPQAHSIAVLADPNLFGNHWQLENAAHALGLELAAIGRCSRGW